MPGNTPYVSHLSCHHATHINICRQAQAHTGAKTFSNRLYWGQLKSTFHKGSRRLHCWHWAGHEEVEIDGHICHSIPGYGYGVTSTKVLNRFRPPSRYKARPMERMRLICNATGFIQAIQRGIQQGLI